MQCPFCKETIDDDSRYCDQCGEQIMVCPKCGRAVKGKRCIFCPNSPLVPAGSVTPSVSATASVAAPAPTAQPIQITQPQQNVQPVPSSQPVQQMPQNVGDKIKLSSPMHGIMIEVKDGDIIGRKNGAFAGVFSRFNFISGTHCKFINNASGWHIQDLGSTNGTFYNGSRLMPNMLYSILNNTAIKIADVELHITYDTDTGGTSRL